MKRSFNNASADVIKKIFGYVGDKEYVTNVRICKNIKNVLYTYPYYALRTCEHLFETKVTNEVLAEQKDEKLDDWRKILIFNRDGRYMYLMYDEFFSNEIHNDNQHPISDECWKKIYDVVGRMNHDCLEWITPVSSEDKKPKFVSHHDYYKDHRHVIDMDVKDDNSKHVLRFNKFVVDILSEQNMELHEPMLFTYRYVTVSYDFTNDDYYSGRYSICHFDHQRYIEDLCEFMLSNDQCFNRLMCCFGSARELSISIMSLLKQLTSYCRNDNFAKYIGAWDCQFSIIEVIYRR
jgi:hypothetical protein